MSTIEGSSNGYQEIDNHAPLNIYHKITENGKRRRKLAMNMLLIAVKLPSLYSRVSTSHAN